MVILVICRFERFDQIAQCGHTLVGLTHHGAVFRLQFGHMLCVVGLDLAHSFRPFGLQDVFSLLVFL